MGPRRGPNASYGDGVLSIRIVGHGLTTGDGPLTITSAVAPTPLVNGTSYYAIVEDADRIQLASSLANALASTAISLTDAGTAPHAIGTTLAVAAVLSPLVGYSDTIAPSFGDGWFDLNESGDPRTELMADGDGPVQLTTTNTLPGPYALATDYWVVTVNGPPSDVGSSRNLAASYADAIARNVIVLIDDGVGVHTIASTGASEHRAHVTLADGTAFTVVD